MHYVSVSQFFMGIFIKMLKCLVRNSLHQTLVLILLQNLKTAMDYFETFVMTVLLKSKQKLPNAYFQT